MASLEKAQNAQNAFYQQHRGHPALNAVTIGRGFTEDDYFLAVSILQDKPDDFPDVSFNEVNVYYRKLTIK